MVYIMRSYGAYTECTEKKKEMREKFVKSWFLKNASWDLIY